MIAKRRRATHMREAIPPVSTRAHVPSRDAAARLSCAVLRPRAVARGRLLSRAGAAVVERRPVERRAAAARFAEPGSRRAHLCGPHRELAWHRGGAFLDRAQGRGGAVLPALGPHRLGRSDPHERLRAGRALVRPGAGSRLRRRRRRGLEPHSPHAGRDRNPTGTGTAATTRPGRARTQTPSSPP